jgi:hypothetical protein
VAEHRAGAAAEVEDLRLGAIRPAQRLLREDAEDDPAPADEPPVPILDPEVLLVEALVLVR